MDSKPKTEYKDFSPQVVPDHTPEAAITQYFLSKYEQRLSKYVSSISFQVFTAVCVQVMVFFGVLHSVVLYFVGFKVLDKCTAVFGILKSHWLVKNLTFPSFMQSCDWPNTSTLSI